MKFITINKDEWDNGLQQSRETYELFGPAEDKNGFLFKKLDPDCLPEMDYHDSVMSPKAVLFPQTEKIMGTSLNESDPDHHIMKRDDAPIPPRAVVGIHPYDAKAVQILDMNFNTDTYKDPYWCDALEATTFVGLGVNKPGACDFSTSTGTGPFNEDGLDILLADLDDKFLAKILTDKGEKYAQACGFETTADETQSQALFDVLRKQAEKEITSTVETGQLKDKTILELYEADFWNDVAFSCINCGTCTYVCPTCWCFDIQDETKLKTATRIRNWDTCMSSLFTRHASGHNPRETREGRVRQRFMHKLKYFVDKYDQGIMCVGCGRCVKSCPVNIDIRDVCRSMNSFNP